MKSLQRLPIERANGLTPDVFQQRYLAGCGKPVILTDVMNSWAALGRWSFEFFRVRYGSDNVAPRIFSATPYVKLMTLSDYLNYLDAPEESAPGLWVDAKSSHPCQAPAEPPASPLYLAWNVFRHHPELLEDIEISPKFVEDWMPLLPAALRATLDEATRYFSAGLMIGPKDARIGLHNDFLDTHAYLAQIVGRKRCVLFSPLDSAALYEGEVNPDSPDFEKYPLFRNATTYECILEPGELLFVPYLWWHHVVGIEKSITVNYNFFNRVNFGSYLTQLFQDLPTIVGGIEHSPDARAALGIQWSSRGFDFPGSGEA
jgi:hypothetical protein